MGDSSFSNSSYLDDIAEYEMIMEINNEDQDEVEAVRMRRYINRERDVAEERLMADYFGPQPKYPAEYFRRRYRKWGPNEEGGAQMKRREKCHE
ncbi:hypothetical protein Tco_1038826 [Tanacetum coccineum]